MVDIAVWLRMFTDALQQTFPGRVCFVGLQGSYARREAADTSDIDMVVILDRLDPQDIRCYRTMLDGLPHRELTCGFLSGKEELRCWEVADLFQFYHDTTPIQGDLDTLMPPIDDEAVARAIHTAVCGIYHACVHNLLYEQDPDILKSLYKSASFAVQAIWYRQSGEYVRFQKTLLDKVGAEECGIISAFLQIKNGEAIDYEALSDRLFRWSQRWIHQFVDTAV